MEPNPVLKEKVRLRCWRENLVDCALLTKRKPFVSQELVWEIFHRVFINDQLYVSMALGMHQDYKDGDDEPKEEVKGLEGNQRWDALEKANLVVDENVKDKVVILLDDLYQSGMSMQYAAMKLLEAGAKNVYGLALVKSLTNNG